MLDCLNVKKKKEREKRDLDTEKQILRVWKIEIAPKQKTKELMAARM